MKTAISTSLLAYAMMMTACSGDQAGKAHLTGNPSTKASNQNVISFKVNDVPVQTSGWNIARFTYKKTGEIHLAVSSNIHKETRTIKANIGGTLPGTYLFKGENATTTYGHYYPDFDKDIFDNYRFESGSFIIQSVDTVNHTLNANFFGKLKNKKGEMLEITEGKIINGKLNTAMEYF